MAIARDSINNGTGGTGTSWTYSHTCSGEDRILLVAGRGGGNSGDRVSTITYNGKNLTRIGNSFAIGSSSEMSTLWYIINPDSGSHNVVITLSSSDYSKWGSVSYTGVDQDNPINVSNTNSVQNSNSVSVSGMVTKDNSWLVGSVKNSIHQLFAGTGTILTSNLGNEGSRMSDSNGVVASGSRSLAYTSSDAGDDWGMVLCAIAPVPIPGGRNPMFFNGGVSVG